MLIFPSLETFEELAKQGNLIPVYTEVITDIETPLSTYLKLKSSSEHSFLLESVQQDERFGRYSFVGIHPNIIFRMTGKKVSLTENGNHSSYETDQDPLKELETLMSKYKPVTFGQLPVFYGGAVGFLSYDCVRFFEKNINAPEEDDLNIPDAYFVVSDSLLIFDHSKRRLKILVHAHIKGDVQETYRQACARIFEITQTLKHPSQQTLVNLSDLPECTPQSNMSQEDYLRKANAIKEYIRAGDVFQTVLSQRLSLPCQKQSVDLYRALRYIHPSPYMFCLDFQDFSLVGSSPETHVRSENGNAEIRCITGTRPRRAQMDDDDAMGRELLSDEHERAQHIMLVDLARNDLGKICEYHSVKVRNLMDIERYFHSMHIMSLVQGKLQSNRNCYDVMRATFPAGSLSGAPKIRALQIIGELEPTRRGPYGGIVGYFGFSGNSDSCTVIQTILLKDRKAYVQAGGTIMADSTLKGEFKESMNTAKAAIKAVALAETFDKNL